MKAKLLRKVGDIAKGSAVEINSIAGHDDAGSDTDAGTDAGCRPTVT